MINGTVEIDGITLGTGTSFPLIEAPKGVLSTAPIRSADEPRPRRDGEVAGGDFKAGKLLEFVFGVLGSSPADAEQKASNLEGLFDASPVDKVLMVRIGGAPAEYAFFGRPRGADVLLDYVHPSLSGPATAIARCTFKATDPTRYGPEQVTPIGLLAHPLPQTLPFTIGYHDSQVVNNPGKTVDRWTVEFEAVAGPLINPSIKHVDQGLIVFSDLVLASGDTLVLDGFRRRALLNGVDPVIPTIAQWWKIAAGAQEIRFAGSASSSLDCTATLTWRPGW